MSLANLQKAVARAVMQPLTRNEHMRVVGPGGERMRRYAARYIKPNDRLTSFARLEVSNLRLRVQPYVQLLELHYPVDDLVLQAKDDEGTNFASNAVGELRRRMKVRAVVALKPQKILLVVHRLDFSVYFRRIEREEYSMLKALHGGNRSLAP